MRSRASSRTKTACKPSQESPGTNRTVELSAFSVLKQQRRHTLLICCLTAFQLRVSFVHIAEVGVNECGHIRPLQGSLVNSEEEYIARVSHTVDSLPESTGQKVSRRPSTITRKTLATSGLLCITASHHHAHLTEANAHPFSIVIDKLLQNKGCAAGS